MKKETYIYCLLEPNTGVPRYVGKTNDLVRRLKAHWNKARFKNTHKSNWIKKLKKEGTKPALRVLEICPITQWKIREKYWIRYFKKRGYKLVNTTGGGEGLNFGNQTSFKKGRIPYNKGTGHVNICKVCDIQFSGCPNCQPSSLRKFCSRECVARWQKENLNTGVFTKDNTPWNKGLVGYTTSKAIPVLQYTIEGGFIKEYRSSKEAANSLGCIPENIRRACVGKSKTAKGFIWKYKNNS